MLTGDLVRPRLRVKEGALTIAFVDAKRKRWRQTAAELLAIWATATGRSRQQIDADVATYLGDRTDFMTVRGMVKVLTDAATFAAPETPHPPATLRRRLFAAGPAFNRAMPSAPQSRSDRIAALAQTLATTPSAIEDSLFADRHAAQRVVDLGPEWTPAGLLARYNLELARAALYWASEMEVTLRGGYQDFWRYLKLFKLMFWATPLPAGGYHVTIDGPISPFVKATTRYGRQMAAFLPALFLGDEWSMTAQVHLPNQRETVSYALDHTLPLASHFKQRGAFDSRMEADFAAEFAAKFGGKRSGWQLGREDELILVDDTVMIPDFSLTHVPTGRRILLEIVGFWHPEYIRRKVAKVRAANRKDLLLLVYENINLSPEKLADIDSELLYFKRKPVLKEVMARVKQMLGEEPPPATQT